MLQLGLRPSHFSFLFLQIIHARRLGFGTLELPLTACSVALCSASRWLVGSETMMVSDGEFDDDDMVGFRCPHTKNARPRSNRVAMGYGSREKGASEGEAQNGQSDGRQEQGNHRVRASPEIEVSGVKLVLGLSACSGLGMESDQALQERRQIAGFARSRANKRAGSRWLGMEPSLGLRYSRTWNLSVFTCRPTRAIRSSDARPEIVRFVMQCDALRVICKALVYR